MQARLIVAPRDKGASCMHTKLVLKPTYHSFTHPGSSHMSLQSRRSRRRCWPSIVDSVAHFGSILPLDLDMLWLGRYCLHTYLGTLAYSLAADLAIRGPAVGKEAHQHFRANQPPGVATIFVSIVEYTGHFVGLHRPAKRGPDPQTSTKETHRHSDNS